jgi:hypothetical protein
MLLLVIYTLEFSTNAFRVYTPPRAKKSMTFSEFPRPFF